MRTLVAISAALLAGVLLPRPAHATVFEKLLGVTDRVVPYLDDGSKIEAPRTVLLNGQKLKVAVGRTNHPTWQVKAWYLQHYQEGWKQLAALTKGKKLPPPTEAVFGDDNEGGMVTLELGETSALAALAKRFQAFARTNRLGELGQIRFVRWSRERGGGTRYLTVSTDRSFSLDALLPPPGVDAGGGDLKGLPRPPGMQRVFAMEEEGRTYRTRVYEGPGSVSETAAYLAAAFAQRHFFEDRQFTERSRDSVAFRFQKEGRTVIVSIDVAESGKVDVALVDDGGGES